uniref:MADS-box transcription factor n=1 Tax=Picea abies TaxID=3329 RepID=Q9SEE1_PICAB|nr:MADS-box transcription factor [Picea abies]
MGRGKIEIKKIENLTNRQVTFSKRKAGLQKKAKELSILCSAEVALIIFSSSGKHYEYSSPCSSVEQIVEKYMNVSGSKLGEDQINTLIDGCVVKGDIEIVGLRRVIRHLTGGDLESLSVNELQKLEDQLEIVTSRVRKKRFQRMQEQLEAMTQELEESKRRLRYNEGFTQKKNDLYMFSDCRGSLGETVDDYPFCQDKNPIYVTPSAPVFCVQPGQPHLHETDYRYLDLKLGYNRN